MFDDSPLSKVLALQDRGLKFDPPEPTQKMGRGGCLGMVAQSRRQRTGRQADPWESLASQSGVW